MPKISENSNFTELVKNAKEAAGTRYSGDVTDLGFSVNDKAEGLVKGFIEEKSQGKPIPFAVFLVKGPSKTRLVRVKLTGFLKPEITESLLKDITLKGAIPMETKVAFEVQKIQDSDTLYLRPTSLVTPIDVNKAPDPVNSGDADDFKIE